MDRFRRFFFVLCFYDFFVPASREKTTDLPAEDSDIFPLLLLDTPLPPFSPPTFQLETLTLCNGPCLGTHPQSGYLFPLSVPEASHFTVAGDFYVDIFIRLFKAAACNAERFQFFFSIKDPVHDGKEWIRGVHMTFDWRQ